MGSVSHNSIMERDVSIDVMRDVSYVLQDSEVYDIIYRNNREVRAVIRMIVTDLDGTFLRDDKTASEYTLDVIKRARERGVIFAVATARPIRSVVEWLPFIEFDVGIFHNGAVIRTPDGDIDGMGIDGPDGIAQAMLRAEPEARISIESEDRLYCNFDPGYIWPGAEYTFTGDFSCMAGRVADKIIVEAHCTEDVEKFARYIPDYAYVVMSENRIAMIMNKKATKINAIRAVAEKYGIDMGDVVAFGDDYNDIDMLRGCGRGIAVANALPEVKAAADDVCGSNMDDGEARWIEENIL